MVKKYVKKPVEVEALQYVGENLGECIEFMENNFDTVRYDSVSETLKINYKIDENELSKISKISDDISDKSLSIIKNIQDTIKNFNNFDIS